VSAGGEPPCFNLPVDAVVYLGLGSNLGDRGANLRGALKAIGAIAEIDAVSTIYESEPVGYSDQPDFWNLVVRVRTCLEPADLFRRLKGIETDLGRTEAFRNAPRVIDIDILAFDALVLDTPALQIPHPRLRERSFVLFPLAEIEPAFRHPATGEPVQSLAAQPGLTRAVSIGELS
jgi:2-amino-4-hydroxy-6-hydroxymethyldihydropteridine diphosphokinase